MLGAREGSPRAPIPTSLCLAAQAFWRSTTLLPRIMAVDTKLSLCMELTK